LVQDAIQRGKERTRHTPAAFAEARAAILNRFDDLLWNGHSGNRDCLRIWKRLFKHGDALFPFLDDPCVPADNNGCERDIRSLAAARNDGGTHRADGSAAAFARIKRVIVTSLKNGLRFIHYGLDAVRAQLQGAPMPLPVKP
jgi:transposase IS66 family protein